MKVITIQHLKQNLSSVLAAAGTGARFLVTRHKRPVAEITAPGTRHLHVGSRFGKTRLRPAVKAKAGTRYLELLAEDRAGRSTDS